MLLNFEVVKLDFKLADSSHKKMLKLRHGLLVVLQYFQDTSWNLVEVAGNQNKGTLKFKNIFEKFLK